MALIVFVTFDVTSGNRSRFIATAQALTEASRLEQGCLVYTFGAGLDDLGEFHLTEVWDSQEALAAHQATPHYQVAAPALAELASVSSVQIWSGDLTAVSAAALLG